MLEGPFTNQRKAANLSVLMAKVKAMEIALDES